MKSLVITSKSKSEFKLINDLLKRLGISAATLTKEDLEGVGLSNLLKSVDKKKKVSRLSVRTRGERQNKKV